jgi:hypothetical protein
MIIKRLALCVAITTVATTSALRAQEILKAQNAQWDFLLYKTLINNAIDPANVDIDFHTTWQDPDDLGYDGPAFTSGFGYFGYGVIAGAPINTNIWNIDGGLATNEPPSGSRYTAYFVTTVTPTQPVAFLSFTGIIDDGAVIYLNGVELTRLNMDPPAIAPDGWLLLASAGGDENNEGSVFAAVNLPAGVPATIAVSLHSSSATSSDMGFDLLIKSEVPDAPANDDFGDAIEMIGDLPLAIAGSTGNGIGGLGATKEASEPNHADDPGTGSVWWKWTPLTAGRVSVSTNGSDFDTLMAVYTGSSVSALASVSRYANLGVPASSADEPFHLASRVEFDAEAGTTYYLAVDGTGGAFGNVTLTIDSNFTFLDPIAKLLPARSDWEYLLAVDATNLPIDPETVDPDFDTTWHSAALYDGPAFSGPASGLLGYGGLIDADEIVTDIWGGRDHDGDLVADAQPPTNFRYATYFRTTFTPGAPVVNLGFEGLVDDGAVIYLNGVEVARMNVGAAKDATNWQVVADGTAIDGVNVERAPQVVFDLERNLPAGVPVEIAVSVHNPNGTSSDMGFDLRVYSVNTPPAPPVLPSFDAIVTLTANPDEYLVSWNSVDGTDYRVEFSPDLESWIIISGAIPGDPGGVTSFLDFPLPEDTTGFYRVVVP